MGETARTVGNFTGISYDMAIINDTNDTATCEDPFSKITTIRSNYRGNYFITPSFSMKVDFYNPDGTRNV